MNPDYSIRKKEGIDINKKAYAVGFVISVILFIVAFFVAHNHPLTGWQLSVFHFFNNWPDSFKTVAGWVTEGLGAGYPIAVCVFVPLLLRRYRLAWRFFFTVGGAGAVMYIIKIIVNEPRPITILGASNFHQRAIETGPGFPSGHMVVATAMAFTLWLILPRAWRWLSFAWIALVAVSRIYLGVHTPADIISAFAIGFAAVCFVVLLPDDLAKKLKLDTETPLLQRYDWPFSSKTKTKTSS